MSRSVSPRWSTLLLAAVPALAAPSTVLADAKAADVAFRKGKALLQKKEYQEACAAFELSFKEDPAIGTQLNTARCYQEWGKSATALAAFQEALRLAREAKDDRLEQITELVAEADREAPVVVISLPAGRLPPEGLTITLDGAELPRGQLGKPLRLDPGSHEVVLHGAGAEPQTLTVTATAKKHSELELPLDGLESTKEEPAATPAPTVDAPDPGRKRRLAGLITGGVGVVGLGVATYLALDARSDYNSAFDAHCMDNNQCDDLGLAATRDARSQANWATAVGGVALATVAAGVYLYVTAPKATEQPQTARVVTPMLWSGGVGLALSGRL